VSLAVFDNIHCSHSSKDGFVLTACRLKLFDKVLSFLFIAHYLLQHFPGLRAFFVGNADYLMNDLIDLFPVAGRDHNAGFIENFVKVTKIARHVILPPFQKATLCLNPSMMKPNASSFL
jgi:hypothetical protein